MSFEDKIVNGGVTLDDQEEALSNPYWACNFAIIVRDADIERCQEVACRDPEFAYYFAHYVLGASITICQKAACKNYKWAYQFACNIKGANIIKSLEACRGTEYEAELSQLLMDRALI